MSQLGRGQDSTLKRMTPVEFRLKRGPALPHGRVQPAHLHRHPLEYRPSRRSDQTTETRRADSRSRFPGPTSHPYDRPTSSSPAHTDGQSADGGLSVRFCPLQGSTRWWSPHRPVSRCLTYGLQVIEVPHLAGVEFRSLSEDFDTATANGKLQLQMVPAFSEWWRNSIR